VSVQAGTGTSAAEPKPKAKRAYSKHGLWSLKATVKLLAGRAIDRRTAVGQALEAWREQLISDLGGREALSTQQLALVDLALKSKLMLDSVDVWILQQPSLVNARKKALLPVVRERAVLAAALRDALRDLGLERKAKVLPPIHQVLAERAAAAQGDDKR
jgi:hypothetical protein